MRLKVDFIEGQWRATRWVLSLFPFWVALIAGLNIWSDYNSGQAFDWDNLLYPLGLIAFGGVLYLWMRLIFKFLRSYAKRKDEESSS